MRKKLTKEQHLRRKLIIGLVLNVSGVVLHEVSYTADVWILRAIGGILFPIGMTMGINSLILLKGNKRSNDSSQQSIEND